jgi:hypothetical protein
MKFRLFDDRTHQLASRRWTDSERRVVWRGLTGRLAIAIEPFLGMTFMALLAWGIVYRSQHVATEHDLYKIAWIFWIGALAFAGYFVAVLIAPFIAYLQTYKPIYKVDGFVRYRRPDGKSGEEGQGYVAALFEDRTVACEWEYFGKRTLEDATIPAMLEFSVYAGIHKIDGRNTGLLPDDLPLLAIGIAPRKGPHPED